MTRVQRAVRLLRTRDVVVEVLERSRIDVRFVDARLETHDALRLDVAAETAVLLVPERRLLTDVESAFAHRFAHGEEQRIGAAAGTHVDTAHRDARAYGLRAERNDRAIDRERTRRLVADVEHAVHDAR